MVSRPIRPQACGEGEGSRLNLRRHAQALPLSDASSAPDTQQTQARGEASKDDGKVIIQAGVTIKPHGTLGHLAWLRAPQEGRGYRVSQQTASPAGSAGASCQDLTAWLRSLTPPLIVPPLPLRFCETWTSGCGADRSDCFVRLGFFNDGSFSDVCDKHRRSSRAHTGASTLRETQASAEPATGLTEHSDG